ncbi:hypothetical protein [Mycolicibacterium smegmatis]|uniref:Extracellular solute-binding protein n=1 Tax=Mycolicibacterium smegmatis (strain MKD8) TaxID=1214915 RepID=A0A2U9PTB9_MYCSE|nr:hypothetical protein [Mycolicibacterium smegmatis]AWT55049.1 hypothetical protein D806_040830 [Mycolicibacterium smegmatis MKD8]
MTLNRRAFLSVSALTLTTSACGVIMGGTIDAKPAKREGPLNDAEFEALVKNAKSEGSVTLYCVAGEETMRAWVRGFQEQYGIQVAIYRATVSDIYRRFKEESTSGRHLADAVSMSVPAYIQDSVDQGWAVQYRTRAHDELDPTLITADAGYPMYAVITAIAWNETAVDTALQERLAQGDYTALGEPELKDRVGIVGPTAGGTQLGTHLAIVDDAHLGWEYLEKLRSSGAAVFESAQSRSLRTICPPANTPPASESQIRWPFRGSTKERRSGSATPIRRQRRCTSSSSAPMHRMPKRAGCCWNGARRARRRPCLQRSPADSSPTANGVTSVRYAPSRGIARRPTGLTLRGNRI